MKKNTVCGVCGKGTRSTNNISHSHRVTKRRQKPNLQIDRRSGRKLRVCTKCLKRQKRDKITLTAA